MSTFPETDLPSSAKKTYRAAAQMGWEVEAYLAVETVEPTFYVGSTDEDATNPHNAGDIRTEGYTARIFTVAARDPLLPVGFRAIYVGKVFQSESKKSIAGSFDCAFVADPIGIAKVLRAKYEPIKATRGKFEAEASHKRNVARALKAAQEMNDAYNDGHIVFDKMKMFKTATEFTNWLAEWHPFHQKASHV